MHGPYGPGILLAGLSSWHLESRRIHAIRVGMPLHCTSQSAIQLACILLPEVTDFHMYCKACLICRQHSTAWPGNSLYYCLESQNSIYKGLLHLQATHFRPQDTLELPLELVVG